MQCSTRICCFTLEYLWRLLGELPEAIQATETKQKTKLVRMLRNHLSTVLSDFIENAGFDEGEDGLWNGIGQDFLTELFATPGTVLNFEEDPGNIVISLDVFDYQERYIWKYVLITMAPVLRFHNVSIRFLLRIFTAPNSKGLFQSTTKFPAAFWTRSIALAMNALNEALSGSVPEKCLFESHNVIRWFGSTNVYVVVARYSGMSSWNIAVAAAVCMRFFG